jgi:hypothetical protein
MEGNGRARCADSWSKAEIGSAQVRSEGPKDGTGRGGATGVGTEGVGSAFPRLDFFGDEVKVGARVISVGSPVDAPTTAAPVPGPWAYRATSRS